MPNISFGQKPQERARFLLESLLDYVDDTLEISIELSKKLTFYWGKNNYQLTVKCTLESLAKLTECKYPSKGLKKREIEEAITFYEKHLKIAFNNCNQGSPERVLVFNLWSKDKINNLNKFNELCQEKDYTKQVNKEATNNYDDIQGTAKIENSKDDSYLSDGLANKSPSSQKLLNELSDLRIKNKNLSEALNEQKQTNEKLEERINRTDCNLNNALKLLLILALPLQMLSGAAYNHIINNQTNSSSVSNSVNTNSSDNSSSGASSEAQKKTSISTYNTNQGKDSQCR
ncbi:hypothetical protein RIVM261_088830 [Rivularia sp. IAM M-261]|nr:hypothetical protein RIVM261_088830 [Rivularia sp. IAM M-261]